MEMSETKTVPTYPTDDMWEAFFLHHHANDSVSEIRFWEGDFGNFAASYAAMLSAAPNIAPEEEACDGLCQEDDGCPTELAVLQRFWRANTAPDELARLERELATGYATNDIREYSSGGWYAINPHDSPWWNKRIRYLELRGLLEHHPTDTNLVRMKEQSGNE